MAHLFVAHLTPFSSHIIHKRKMSSKSALELIDDLIAELQVAIGSDPVPSTSSTTPPPAPVEGNTKEEKKGKGEKKGKEKKEATVVTAAAAPTPAANPEEITVNSIDLRVGIIRKVSKHPTAEKLYCEEIDIGEEKPREIASGLVPYYSLEEMMGRRLIVVCNLKPRSLVGFKSNGMVLCASKTLSDGSQKVEFVDPPLDAQPGDRITGEGLVGEPLSASQCDKRKAFEVVAADLLVDGDGVAHWKGHRLVTPAGEVLRAPTLREAPLK